MGSVLASPNVLYQTLVWQLSYSTHFVFSYIVICNLRLECLYSRVICLRGYSVYVKKRAEVRETFFLFYLESYATYYHFLSQRNWKLFLIKLKKNPPSYKTVPHK